MWEEFEPCPNMFPHADGEILDDEIVIIHPSSSAGEPEIFEPYTRVHLPGVLGDVGGWLEVLWERCSLDASTKGPRFLAIRARTPVIRPTIMSGVCSTAPLVGPTRVCVACP